MKFNNITSLKKIAPIICVLSYALYPIIVLYAHNVEEVVLYQITLPIIFTLASSTILFVFWRIILKSNLKASLATVFLVLILWYYGLLFTGISKLIELKHWHLIPLLFFIYFHLVYFISKVKQQNTLNNINTILLFPILLLILFNIISILPAELKKANFLNKNNIKEIPTVHKFNTVKNHPDIYLIILDEYASFKTIKKEWDFDNSKFSEFLEEKGFYVAKDSEWPYINTIWNMASLLNLEYLTRLTEKQDYLDFYYNREGIIGSESFDVLSKMKLYNAIQMLNNNALTKYLKEQEYKIIVLEGISQHYSSFKINNADISIAYQDVNNIDQYSFLTDAFNIELIRISIISSFNYLFKINPLSNVNYGGTKYVFNYLKTEALYLDSPKFIYAHILCPHNPYIFDRKGNYIPNYPQAGVDRVGSFVSSTNSVNEAYLEQYIYSTNEVKIIINSILENSPVRPIIILQSDHSPRPHEVYLKDKMNAFSVLNAVYLPNGDYKNMYDSIAPINTLRVVLNKYFDKNYKLLEDR